MTRRLVVFLTALSLTALAACSSSGHAGKLTSAPASSPTSATSPTSADAQVTSTYPSGPDGGFLTTRPSAVPVIAALRRVSVLEVSRPVRENLGHGLALIHVDVRLPPSAPRSGFQYLS